MSGDRGAGHPTPTVKFQRGWSEWRGECACGWVGSYLKERGAALREAAAHAMDAAGTDHSSEGAE